MITRKDYNIYIRTDADGKKKIEALANLYGVSMGACLRALIDERYAQEFKKKTKKK